jgi:hypothetical protein
MPLPPVVSTATLQCTFGLSPSTLSVLPVSGVMIEGRPAATIADAAPTVNIPPFGMCTSLSNPTVAAATASALGVLTPMPCLPVTTAWVPGAPQTAIGGRPALTSASKCACAYGGIISVINPGSTRTMAG